MFDLYEAVADLQAGWQTLHDTDKAEKITNILNHGTSRRTLAYGTLPKAGAPVGMPVQEIIQRLRRIPPAEPSFVANYALWLARWLYFAFPDTWICHKALDLAWAQLIRR